MFFLKEINRYITEDIFRKHYLHHHCYKYAEVVPVTAIWNNLSKLVASVIMVHGVDPSPPPPS